MRADWSGSGRSIRAVRGSRSPASAHLVPIVADAPAGSRSSVRRAPAPAPAWAAARSNGRRERSDGAAPRLAALARAGHHVARHVAEDLLGTGQRSLAFAVFRGEALDAADFDFDQLIDRAHAGCVSG